MSANGAFWNTEQLAEQYGNNIALIERVNTVDNVVTYLQLEHLVTSAKVVLYKRLQGEPEQKKLLMMVAHNSINSIVYYLAALQLKLVIWWVDKNSDEIRLQELQQHYAVNLFIDNGEITKLSNDVNLLHPDLALLITTSGSTGSPTLVRLSYKNLASNCHDIVQALSLKSLDNTITTLPLQYSFGLSIVNTHLLSGSAIVLNEHSFVSRDFWNLMKENNIQCLYGVPHSFDMLLKLSLPRLPLKSLRFMAVAGGKLSADKVSVINDYCSENNSQFYVMYGQTEATARLTILSPIKTAQKPFSIGKAINGRLWLESDEKVVDTAGAIGELCYQGDNVMMGLAETVDDLALPVMLSILHTGDLAQFDQEGDFEIVGRLKRIVKVAGHRINLDEIEQYFSAQHRSVACTGQDDKVFCYLLNESSNEQSPPMQYKKQLSEYLSIHSSYFDWIYVNTFPYLASGKLDYQQLDQIHLSREKS